MCLSVQGGEYTGVGLSLCACPTCMPVTLVWGLGVETMWTGAHRVFTTERQRGPTTARCPLSHRSSFAQHFPKAYSPYPNLLSHPWVPMKLLLSFLNSYLGRLRPRGVDGPSPLAAPSCPSSFLPESEG